MAGRRLVAAQPRELAVGNIVRRVLGLIRDEAQEDRTEGDISGMSSDAGSRPMTPTRGISGIPLHGEKASPSPSRSTARPRGITESAISGLTARPALASVQTAIGPSMLSIFSHAGLDSQSSTPASPAGAGTPTTRSVEASSAIRAEIMEGITEIIEELDKSDEQIADYALEHIHAGEIILTHTSSLTVRRFLLKAAAKRTFTVILAEGYPNGQKDTYSSLLNQTPNHHLRSFEKPLTAAGITVVLITDAAAFAMMSRVNKVILGTHAVLANGSLLAAAGAKMIAEAAQVHRIPVVVLTATFKLCPEHAFDPEMYLEYGDPSKLIGYQDRDFVGYGEVTNQVIDFVPPDLVSLYITNVGGHAPSYLDRIIKDQYRDEDVDL